MTAHMHILPKQPLKYTYIYINIHTYIHITYIYIYAYAYIFQGLLKCIYKHTYIHNICFGKIYIDVLIYECLNHLNC